MRATNADRQEASPPAVIFLQKIDEALSHRHEIIERLESIRLAPESKGFRSDIDAFVAALRSDLNARDFVKEGAFAAWLPAILSWKSGEALRSQQVSQLAMAISRNADIRWSDSNSLVYIQIVLFAAFSTFLFLCGMVIPVFDKMFKEFQLKLPIATQMVIWVSSKFGPHAKEIFLMVVSSSIMIWLGKRILRRLSQGRFFASYFALLAKGSSLRVNSMSRWLIALSSLLKIGTPLREAMIIAGRASQNELLVQHAVRLSLEMKETPIEFCPTARAFPPIVIDSLRENGLTHGDLLCTADLLHELGLIYCERARHRYHLMLKFLYPIFIMLIGGGTAFVILALFLPLMSMLQQF